MAAWGRETAGSRGGKQASEPYYSRRYIQDGQLATTRLMLGTCPRRSKNQASYEALNQVSPRIQHARCWATACALHRRPSNRLHLATFFAPLCRLLFATSKKRHCVTFKVCGIARLPAHRYRHAKPALGEVESANKISVLGYLPSDIPYKT